MLLAPSPLNLCWLLGSHSMTWPMCFPLRKTSLEPINFVQINGFSTLLFVEIVTGFLLAHFGSISELPLWHSFLKCNEWLAKKNTEIDICIVYTMPWELNLNQFKPFISKPQYTIKNRYIILSSLPTGFAIHSVFDNQQASGIWVMKISLNGICCTNNN